MAQTQEKAREVAGQAQEKARDAAGQARGRVSQEVDRRSTEAGQQVASNAGDARSVAEELRKQGKEKPARYVEQAADRAERLGGYLQESDGDRILRDVEDFARRNPWAVAAGGLVLGFVASRMLKASSGERYRSSFSGDGNGVPGAVPGEPIVPGAVPGEPVGHGTRASQFDPHV
ncbi:MAG TPA: hypothetical protein VG126_17895 [Thermoleophilaceae bacterium]|nr:hypothetical protein [Thermoleophilaceae bacterium]